jgi:hypothetical protein
MLGLELLAYGCLLACGVHWLGFYVAPQQDGGIKGQVIISKEPKGHCLVNTARDSIIFLCIKSCAILMIGLLHDTQQTTNS